MSSVPSQSQQSAHQVEIHKENARELYPLLKALMFREHCSLTICTGGMRVIVDDQHHQQATVYLKQDLFAKYVVQAANVQLRLPMSVFAVSHDLADPILTIPSGTLKMHYDGEGHPLVMNMDDEGIHSVCEINTQIPLPILDFEFSADDMVAKVIARPQVIRDTFREFDPSSPTVRISVTPTEFAFYTDGELGKVKIAIPSHSEHLELVDCLVERVSFNYRLMLLKRMVGSLALCSRVSFRVDDRGVLSIQFLVPQADQQAVFVEFYCVADNDVYD